MPLTASDTNKSFDPAPPGTHPAICYAVVDLGTQTGEYQGEVTVRHQVWIAWEFPELMFEMEDGPPMPKTISIFLTLSLHDKSSMKPLLEGWRGKSFSDDEKEGFDIKNLLEKPCLINVIHDRDGKQKINAIMPPDDKAKAFKLKHNRTYFSFEDGGEIPASVSDGIKRIIMKSTEYNETGQQNDYDYHGPDEPPIHGEEDIPF